MWYYVFYMRSTDTDTRFAKGRVNGMNGIILLPDNWSYVVWGFYGCSVRLVRDL